MLAPAPRTLSRTLQARATMRDQHAQALGKTRNFLPPKVSPTRAVNKGVQGGVPAAAR